jgi:hypothetical protein
MVSAFDQMAAFVASTSRFRVFSGGRAAYLIGAMTYPPVVSAIRGQLTKVWHTLTPEGLVAK